MGKSRERFLKIRRDYHNKLKKMEYKRENRRRTKFFGKGKI